MLYIDDILTTIQGSVVKLESCISAVFNTEILDDAQNLLVRCCVTVMEI